MTEFQSIMAFVRAVERQDIGLELLGSLVCIDKILCRVVLSGGRILPYFEARPF